MSLVSAYYTWSSVLSAWFFDGFVFLFLMVFWLYMTKIVPQKAATELQEKWAEKKPTCAVRRRSRTSRFATSMYQGVKEVERSERYSCKPPKLFIITITLIQMMVYLIFLWWVLSWVINGWWHWFGFRLFWFLLNQGSAAQYVV